MPAHFSVRAKLSPATIPASCLRYNLLPVTLQLTAILSGTRPVILESGHTPFSYCTMPGVTGWAGVEKPGPCSLCFLDRDNMSPVLVLQEIAPCGERTTLPVPIDPRAIARGVTSWTRDTEGFKYLAPGEPWVSEELDIPNFVCRPGYRYEVNILEQKEEFPWWCFGSKKQMSATWMEDGDEELWMEKQRSIMRTELREWDPPGVEIDHSDDQWPFTVGEEMSFELVESEGFEVLPDH